MQARLEEKWTTTSNVYMCVYKTDQHIISPSNVNKMSGNIGGENIELDDSQSCQNVVIHL